MAGGQADSSMIPDHCVGAFGVSPVATIESGLMSMSSLPSLSISGAGGRRIGGSGSEVTFDKEKLSKVKRNDPGKVRPSASIAACHLPAYGLVSRGLVAPAFGEEPVTGGVVFVY